MANEVIEKLVVEIESDIDDLIKNTDKGIDKAEGSLKKFERTGKKTFDVLKKGVVALTAVVAALIVSIGLLVKAAEQGLAGIRIRRSFKNLAVTAQQSGAEILAAMKMASEGTVTELDLMRQANVALQLGVARTPEEFAKLTRSAITLGRAVGAGPVEAMELLINAAGRRSTEVLDNLGISLADVNSKMEEFAQRDFGKNSQQLSQVQRNALFMQATLEVADQKAKGLADGLNDIGTSAEQAGVRVKELGADFNEASVIVTGIVSKAAVKFLDGFFGPNGVFPLIQEGGNIIAEVFARLLASLASFGAATVSIVSDIKGVLEGELSPAILTQAELTKRAANEMAKAYDIALSQVKTDFAEVFDPDAIDAIPITPPSIETETIEETSKEATDAFERLSTEFIDLQEETNQQIEDSEKEHRANMLSIIRQAADARKEVEQDALNETLELEEEITKERADIIANTKKQLAQLEQDTDKDLASERENFQRDELRETEDHLRGLRRLRLSFLDNLEDAVTSRDAGRVRDLQRQFARENKERSEDFNTKQKREKQDQNIRLAEIRQNEADRTAEIMAAQSEQLESLRVHEAERRQEINNSLQKQLEEINQAAAQAQVDETQSYIERQKELDSALAKRLESVAKELSDENDITREGSQAILQTLNNFFGIGGEIDTLMDGFDARRRARSQAQLGLANQTSVNKSLKTVQSVINSIPSFATGGSMIARKPTLAMFGEAGPEMAQFTPMNRVGSGNPQKVQIEFSGSAPPGIGINERDQIAGVILRAMREAGA